MSCGSRRGGMQLLWNRTSSRDLGRREHAPRSLSGAQTCAAVYGRGFLHSPQQGARENTRGRRRGACKRAKKSAFRTCAYGLSILCFVCIYRYCIGLDYGLTCITVTKINAGGHTRHHTCVAMLPFMTTHAWRPRFGPLTRPPPTLELVH